MLLEALKEVAAQYIEAHAKARRDMVSPALGCRQCAERLDDTLGRMTV